MISKSVQIYDHMFGLLDDGPIPFETGDWANGLVRVMQSGALVYTGIDSGGVGVVGSVLTERPEYVDTGDWDDVIEVSVWAPHGNLRIATIREERYLGEEPLSREGSGWYRVRVSVRGRDANYDKYVPESGEKYLVEVWSSAPAPEEALKQTDWCGRSLRAAAQADVGLPTQENKP